MHQRGDQAKQTAFALLMNGMPFGSNSTIVPASEAVIGIEVLFFLI